MPSRRWPAVALGLACCSALFVGAHVDAQDAPAAAQAPAPKAASVKMWVGRHAEIEEYIRKAKVVREKDLPVGVTRPKRLFFEEGGPVGSAAWSSIDVQFPQWDSYRSDIAAYEMDKMLQLNMVPPVVEREYRREIGRVSMWVENMKMYDMKNPPVIPPHFRAAWTKQIVDMKMFDQLIGNIDRNQGNMLYDDSYELVLIDHTRAFAVGNTLPGTPFEHVDKDLWQRMLALTDTQLKAKLEKRLLRSLWKDILKRRDLMQKEIDKLVAAKGDAAWIQ